MIRVSRRNDLDALLQNTNLVFFLKAGASWCAPCARISPVWEKLVQKYKVRGLVFDVDSDRKLTEALHERMGGAQLRLPTFFCFPPIEVDKSKLRVPLHFVGADPAGLEAWMRAVLVGLKTR